MKIWTCKCCELWLKEAAGQEIQHNLAYCPYNMHTSWRKTVWLAVVSTEINKWFKPYCIRDMTVRLFDCLLMTRLWFSLSVNVMKSVVFDSVGIEKTQPEIKIHQLILNSVTLWVNCIHSPCNVTVHAIIFLYDYPVYSVDTALNTVISRSGSVSVTGVCIWCLSYIFYFDEFII